MHGRHAERSDHPSVLDAFETYYTTRDRAVRNQLVLDHQWIAERCARRFRDRGEPWSDLMQVALVALVKAVDRFDPHRGSTFPSFAVPTVMGELRRHFRDATWSMRVPRRSKELVVRLGAATDALHQRLGRSPTVQELAAELGEPRDVVIEAIEANRAYRPTPLDTPLRSLDGSSSSSTVADQLTSDHDDATAADLQVVASAALTVLDRRSREIVYWRFFEERTQAEIGERLGISQVQVSRLLRAAIDRIRAEVGTDGDDHDGARDTSTRKEHEDAR